MNIHQLLTYPRSGSRYLIKLVNNNTDLKLEPSHEYEPEDGKLIISIVRDPLDSIVSHLAMFNDLRVYTASPFLRKKLFPLKFIEKYISLTEKITLVSDLIINYDVLVNDPMSVLQEISLLTNCKIVGDNLDTNLPHIMGVGHVKTSVGLDSYSVMKDIVSSMDLSVAYSVYNKAISLSV